MLRRTASANPSASGALFGRRGPDRPSPPGGRSPARARPPGTALREAPLRQGASRRRRSLVPERSLGSPLAGPRGPGADGDPSGGRAVPGAAAKLAAWGGVSPAQARELARERRWQRALRGRASQKRAGHIASGASCESIDGSGPSAAARLAKSMRAFEGGRPRRRSLRRRAGSAAAAASEAARACQFEQHRKNPALHSRLAPPIHGPGVCIPSSCLLALPAGRRAVVSEPPQKENITLRWACLSLSCSFCLHNAGAVSCRSHPARASPTASSFLLPVQVSETKRSSADQQLASSPMRHTRFGLPERSTRPL
jgi:hypothetical protein